MSAAEATAVVELADVIHHDDEIHVTCPNCDPLGLHALCGIQLDEDDEWLDGECEATCVVCSDLDARPCPRCGAMS